MAYGELNDVLHCKLLFCYKPVGMGRDFCAAKWVPRMISDRGDFRPVHFSSDALPARDRIAVWREVYGQTTLRLDIEPLRDRPFQADMRLRALPGLKLVAGMVGGVRDARTRALMADGNDDFGLALNWTGQCVASQCGQEAALGTRDAVLLSCGHVGTFFRPSPTRYIGIRIPRAVLTALVPDVDNMLGRLIPRVDGTLKLLHDYAAMLLGDDVLTTRESQHLAVNHVYDLVALTLGATRDTAAIAEGRGARVARLRAIKADIDKNLNRRDLTLNSLAVRQRVTPRYIQRLFASEGTSFTEYVLGRRLNLAHSLLNDPRLTDRPVSAIAYEAGFGDLSNFNRVFRRHYGATPSDIRAKMVGRAN
jgi:AraC-like DNA-binding protein